MSGSLPPPAALMRGGRTLLIRLAPIVAAGVVFLVATGHMTWALGGSSEMAEMRTLGEFVVVCALAVGCGFGVRLLLLGQADGQPASQPGRSAPPQDGLEARDRLAFYVIGAGMGAITLVALGIIVALGVNDSAKLETTGMTVFTTILPVLSTWVGTILTFYFAKESFRQGSESSQTAGVTSGGESITRPGTMIPYARIIRYRVDVRRDPATGALDPQIDAEELQKLFQPPGIVRVVIFGPDKQPLFVIRHEMVSNIATDTALAAFLHDEATRKTITNFDFASSRGTIADGRRLLDTRQVTDLFVTENGRSTEPVIGWVPDDNLKAGA